MLSIWWICSYYTGKHYSLSSKFVIQVYKIKFISTILATPPFTVHTHIFFLSLSHFNVYEILY